MRRSLFSLLGLITLWSLFYAGFKYFFWWVYEGTDFAPTLEGISAYVLIGSMIAYVIWGPLYARLSERTMLFVALSIGFIFFLSAFYLPAYSSGLFYLSMSGLGLAYSLYVIGKNTLIGREIATSSLGSSAVGAYTTIIFIVFLIVGTIVGSKIGETPSFLQIGLFYFVSIILFAVLLLSVMDTRRDRIEYHFSLDLYKRLFFRYGIFMIGLACFWQISVEASQVAINYSKEFFGKSNSEASLLLLFSSVWAILGNILSVKVSAWRRKSFVVLTLCFIAVIFAFSTILSLAHTQDLYIIVQILAGVIGFFFGASVNLAESHFYALLGEDADKDYTSALYGFILSLVGAILMFIAEKILHTGSYTIMSIFLGFLACMALYGGYRGINIQK